MKFSIKKILLGIICLVCAVLEYAILHGIAAFSIGMPYVAFCLCSLVIGVKTKKVRATAIVFLSGFVLLPIFEFIYSRLLGSLAINPIPAMLVVFVQTCIYFAWFLLVNFWIRGEKFSFSRIVSIPAFVCIAVFSVIQWVRDMILLEALEGGRFVLFLIQIGGDVFATVLPGLIFYAALWAFSVKFLKET